MSARARVARWWAGEAGVAGTALDAALAPAEWLFRGAVAARGAAYERGWLARERAPVPVVSVGNLGVGGAGKTPFSAWVATRLMEWGYRPAIGLRGYGDDEVQVHRKLNPEVPVFAAPRRIDAARNAAAAGCDVVVLDDAFQHRALARDLDVVLVSVEAWTDHPRLLPRGPWREPPEALRRADFIVATRKSASPERATQVAARLREAAPGVPLAHCDLGAGELVPLHAADGAHGPGTPRDGPVLAVAGLAAPGPFAEQLRERGFQVELAAFPDHHPFSAEDARGLLRRAGVRPMVMTLKDAVKLRPLLSREPPAYVLTQTVRITSGGELLDAALRRAAGGDP